MALVIAALLGLILAPAASGYVDYADVDPDRVYSDQELELQEAIDLLEPRAMERWPDSFAGLWLGPRSLGDRIYVAFTDAAEKKVADLAEELDFPRSGLLQAMEAERSLRDLEALQQEMIEERDRALPGTSPVPGTSEADYALDIDVHRNVVVVAATERVSDAAQDLTSERYEGAVIIEEDAAPLRDYCIRSDCHPLRGGLTTGFVRPNGTTAPCTMGFTVARNGNRHVLSAGHCTETNDGWPARHGGGRYGTVGKSVNSGRVDALRARVHLNDYHARGFMFINNNNPAVKVQGRTTWSGLAIGSSVCKSGRATGNTCGTVTSKTFAPPGFERLVVASTDAAHGDSGAPLRRVPDNYAVGVLKGGSPEGVMYSHIEYVLNRLDVSLVRFGN